MEDNIQEMYEKARKAFEEVEYVRGMENPAEVMPNVARWLVAHGYGDDDITKVVGKNVLRVLEETWAR